jgi:hypothetical protein
VNGPYRIRYKWMDFDAPEAEPEVCPTWDQACRFMRQLLKDGYIIIGVEFA